MSDIVARLQKAKSECQLSPCDCQCFLHQDAIDEIERLRKTLALAVIHQDAIDKIERLHKALALAVGELSTHPQYQYLSPEQLLTQFLAEARRDDQAHS